MVKENLEDVISIAVDQELDLLVWSDGKSKSIEYSNIHGMYRATLYQEADMHPISMAVYSKFLFWIEKDKRTIEKLPLDLNLGKNKQTIFTKLMHLTDIIAVPRMNKTSSNLYCTVSGFLLFCFCRICHFLGLGHVESHIQATCDISKSKPGWFLKLQTKLPMF